MKTGLATGALASRWQRLKRREQFALLLAGGAVALFVLYLGLVRPLVALRQETQRSVGAAQTTYLQVVSAAQELDFLRWSSVEAGPAGADRLPLRTRISRSAADLGLALSRVQPGEDGQLSVWLDQADARLVLKWLGRLKTASEAEALRVTMGPATAQGSAAATGNVAVFILFADPLGGR